MNVCINRYKNKPLNVCANNQEIAASEFHYLLIARYAFTLRWTRLSWLSFFQAANVVDKEEPLGLRLNQV